MLTPRENFMETITKGGKPDRFVKQYEAVKIVRNDPVFRFLRGNFIKGTDFIDRWGTTMSWPEDQCGATPHITEEKKVLRDISHWRDYVTVPNLLANCSTGWEDAQRTIAEIDRKEYLVACYMGTGIFEQSHFLMGFEDTLLNTLAEAGERDPNLLTNEKVQQIITQLDKGPVQNAALNQLLMRLKRE